MLIYSVTFDSIIAVNVDQWLDSAYEALVKEAEIQAQKEAQKEPEPAETSQSSGVSKKKCMWLTLIPLGRGAPSKALCNCHSYRPVIQDLGHMKC